MLPTRLGTQMTDHAVIAARHISAIMEVAKRLDGRLATP